MPLTPSGAQRARLARDLRKAQIDLGHALAQAKRTRDDYMTVGEVLTALRGVNEAEVTNILRIRRGNGTTVIGWWAET